MAEQIEKSTTGNVQTPLLNHSTPPTKSRPSCYLYFLTFFTAIGGFLFGYDTGVISGAMILLKKEFHLNNELQEVVVSLALVGAILGSVSSGPLNNLLGRRCVLILGGFIFTLGSILMGAANGVIMILFGRFAVGLGIGYASMTVPVYIAEAAPAHMRGQLVTVNQLFITMGQFIASLLNGAFSGMESDGWRYMLGIAAIPSFVMFVGFFFMPESPRYLLSKGNQEDAARVLQLLRGSDNIDAELQAMSDAISSDCHKEGFVLAKIFRTPSVRRALLIGCALQAFQQLSGINTVMYYSATIIELAGVQDQSTIIWLAAAVACGNFVFTLISMLFIEKVGRRKLVLCSMFGIVVALGLLAGVFFDIENEYWPVAYTASVNYTGTTCRAYSSCSGCVRQTHCGFCAVMDGSRLLNSTCLESFGVVPSYCAAESFSSARSPEWFSATCPTANAWLPVVAMVFYLAMFAPGLGPMPWCINTEIYPLWARSTGTSISTATNWCFNLLISLTFLNVMEWLTRPGAFVLYSSISFVGLIVFFLLLPETKERKLENIEALFDGPLIVPCTKES